MPAVERRVDLGPQLRLDRLGGGVLAHRGDGRPEVAGLVGEARRARRTRQRAPAIGLLLAVERQMHAEVERGIGSGHRDRLGKPGARRHHRACAARSHHRELLKGGVGPMGHADVILVDHDGAGACGVRGRAHGSSLWLLSSTIAHATRATRSVNSSNSISSRRKCAAIRPCASTVRSSATDKAWRKLCVMRITACPWLRACTI